MALISILAARRLLESPWGRMAESIRDNTAWATALRVPTQTLKCVACVFGGALAGAAGSLYAHYQQYVHPDSFGLIPSITVLLAVILGGKGNLTGSVLGSLIVVLFPEALRICLPGAADWRELGIASMLLGTAILFPSGLLGRFPYLDPLRRRPKRQPRSLGRPVPVIDEDYFCGEAATATASVSLGGATIVKGASIRVDPGTFLALVGPNASGKSTLGRALAGEIPSEGNLIFRLRKIPLFPRTQVDRGVVLYVSQHPSGFAGLTALDNVRIPADVSTNWNPWLAWLSRSLIAVNSATHSAAEEALSWVGLTHVANRMFSQLSYGQKKRVLIAAALLAGPPLLILDEPFAGLNNGEQAEAAVVSQALRALRAHPKYGTILIDHRVQLLEPLCSSMVLFDDGKVEVAGPIETILKTAQYREIYGRPTS
jgi:branched-chain amino acid transport system permease protein